MPTHAMGEYRDHLIRVNDGIGIFARDFAANVGGIPVVCLPGLTRNHRDFTQLAELLTQGDTPRRVICIDLRGRGGSDRDPDPSHYNLMTEMEDVVTVLDALGVTQADFIGTSRGGLLMHFLAALHPDRIRRVVLNDIGPVIEKQGLIRIRDYLSQNATPQSWDDIPAHLKAVHGSSFPNLPACEWEAMAVALYRDDNGKPIADFDPAIAAQISNTDFDKPIPDLWAQYEALCQFPLLIVRGELSELLSQQSCDMMIAKNPLATQITAPQQGHAPLLHIAPIAQAIAAFLNKAAT
jgi:pimeloyl-ACP methyl ester carboxylesterase